MIEPQPIAPVERPAQLRDYLAVVRRRKWTIVATTLLFALAGLAFTLRQTPTYRSEAKILINPPAVSSTRAANDLVDLETESQTLHSPAIAELARKKMGSSLTPGQLLDRLDVTSAGESRVLVVSYIDEDAAIAQKGAQAFAESYLEFKVQDAQEAKRQRIVELKKLRGGLAARFRQARVDCAEAEDQSTEKIQRCNDARNLGAQIEGVRDRLTDVQTQAIDPAELIGQATQAFAAGSKRFIFPIGAAFLGLVIGLAIAFMREGMDDSLRGASDLEQHLGAPVLGIIPKVKNWTNVKVPRLVMLESPGGTAAEAYRTLRTSLLYNAAQRGLKSILVLSAFPGEGKTTTAVNLAIVLAQAQKRVVLVSADLRKPRTHQFLKVRNEGGLTQVLAGDTRLEQAVADPGIDNLRFLPSGPMVAGQAELLGSEYMEKLLTELREMGDFVIIDSPPLVVSDPLTLAPLVDAVLYVADASKTRRGVVTRAREQLEQVGAVVIGAVLNNFDPSKDREEAYPSGYGYTYGYQYTPRPPAPAAPQPAR